MDDSPQTNMVQCPRCNELVKEHRLKKHLKKVHSPEAEKKRIAEQIFRQQEREMQNRIIKCHVCKSEVKRRNLEKHLKENHGINSLPTLVMGNATDNLNSIKTEAKKGKWFAGDKPEYSEDVFDRCKVLSGGAFGLGKKR